MPRILALLSTLLLAPGCGGEVGDGAGADGGTGGDGGGSDAGEDQSRAPQFAELWYVSADTLVYIPLDPATGEAEDFVSGPLSIDLPDGQNLLTMLDDGSLLGARLSKDDGLTYFYRIAQPPRDGSEAATETLGTMIENLKLEGLYTDCDGRLYGMDTGADETNAEGNRLLRFTGDPLASDFTYTQISDLSTADVADIDDMGPGISSAGDITDNPGLAIDTGTVHDFNYQTGAGTEVGSGGTYGIHALGGPLFDDGVARLYVQASSAEIFEMDPMTFETTSLGTGPTGLSGANDGWGGLAGPLTDCETGFEPIE